MCINNAQQELLDKLWVDTVNRIGPENIIMRKPWEKSPPIKIEDFNAL